MKEEKKKSPLTEEEKIKAKKNRPEYKKKRVIIPTITALIFSFNLFISGLKRTIPAEMSICSISSVDITIPI